MTIDEKIKGAIYGMALGDALGYGTEFMTRKEVRSYYPEGLNSFDQFIRDMHRSMHTAGSWTSDTETMLRMIEAAIEDEGIILPHIAGKLLEWYNEGQQDIVTPYRLVIPAEGWVENPIVVCHQTWRGNGLLEASNEALLRSLLIGIFADEENPIDTLSQRLVNITHDDSRCVASTAIAAHIVRSYLYEDTEPEYDKIYDLCHSIDDRTLIFLKTAKDGQLEDFEIDDPETSWFTRKSMGVALWALWHLKTPEEILHTLVNAGGDADTNAALAMMLAGLKFGYEALPPLKEKIVKKERLDDYASRLAEVVKKRIK